jgi:sulfotransferase
VVNNKRYAFLAGLPRSGSTLLSSILNQNPIIHSGANSPMFGMMMTLENGIMSTQQFNAYPKPQVVPSMIYGLLESFYSDRSESLIIDKCREWSNPNGFELLKKILPYQPKIILTVRTIVEILASFINLIHNNKESVSFIDQEMEARREFYFYRHPDENRCDALMRPNGLIDKSLYGIAFACNSEYSKNFHFVEYEDLINDTAKTIDKIYDFLEIERFNHDYENIENKFLEKDDTYGLKGMHDVRPNISPSVVRPEKLLSPLTILKYSNIEFWRN